MPVEVGEEAPDFELSDQHGQRVRLSSYRGTKAVLVVFYPFSFSGICGSELHALEEARAELDNETVALLAVSVDSMYAQRAYAERDGFSYPLLADFWPHGEVATAYGVFDEKAGAAVRGTFLVDRDGVVRWTLVNDIGDGRDVAELVKAVAAL
jgi:peroxiredoxin